MNDINKYELHEVLGKGVFGKVYKATRLSDNTLVAIKTINLKKTIDSNVSEKRAHEEINTLIDFSKTNRNKHIVRYYESFINKDQNGEKYVYIVSEYIEGPTLQNFIQNNKTFSVNYIWPMMMQLLVGLSDIHSKGYAHRDIKPQNIMVDLSNPNSLRLVYIDFGLSCKKKCGNFVRCHNLCKKSSYAGSPIYMPPYFHQNPNRMEKFDWAKKHDVWSLGLVFYFMVNKKTKYPYIFKKNDRSDVFRNGIEILSNYKYDTDDRTNSFIHFMLAENFEDIPDINLCLTTFISQVASQTWV